jgi:LmbE family N-acetylglucosaminyl deacetylase
MAVVMPSGRVVFDARVADRTIHGQGTPERAWRGWHGLKVLAPLSPDELAPRGSRVVVVAPHPDDEVLGCGGALALLARAGREIVVVGVTDGEGSHPGSIAWTPTLLARRRRGERADGLARLGVPAPAHALGLPDGGVAEQEDALAVRLRELLQPCDVVLATWRLDGHPDHEAAGRAAAVAAAACGCPLWEVPVWMWHWAAPGDPRVPWQRLRRLGLDPEARERKSRAIAAHGSQLVETPTERRPPVLPDWALARLLRPFEVFIEAESVR